MKLNIINALCAQNAACDMVSLTFRSIISLFAATSVVERTPSTASSPNFVPAVHSFQPTSNSAFHLPSNLRIVVDSAYAASTQDDGLTLIPPSLHSFAQTFAADVKELFPSSSASVSLGPESSLNKLSNYVFVTLDPSANYTLASGSPTTEGYEMEVTSQGVKISAAGAKGAFWATRTLLQGFVLSGGQFPASVIKDQPDWRTRGIMLGDVLLLDDQIIQF